MKYAYVHKNFRDLSFEKKVIFGSHFITLIVCFFPWFEAVFEYQENFFYNAFQGPGFLIGVFVFLISLVIVLLYLDRLLEKEIIKLSFNENWLYAASGAQQLLLIILIWSVMLPTTENPTNFDVRFGLFIALTAQVAGLVATFLNYQLDKQHEAKKFFQHPSPSLDTKNTEE